MNLEKYRVLFVEEAADHLAEMSRALAALERRDGDANAQASIDTLFRMAHSIKGMASSLDYESVASLAHRLEDWLEPMRSAGALPDAALPLLYEVVGALEEMVGRIAEDAAAPPPREDVLAKLAACGGLAAPARAEDAPPKKARSCPRLLYRDPSAFARRRSIASSRQSES